jgi:hypothetical protein
MSITEFLTRIHRKKRRNTVAAIYYMQGKAFAYTS